MYFYEQPSWRQYSHIMSEQRAVGMYDSYRCADDLQMVHIRNFLVFAHKSDDIVTQQSGRDVRVCLLQTTHIEVKKGHTYCSTALRHLE